MFSGWQHFWKLEVSFSSRSISELSLLFLLQLLLLMFYRTCLGPWIHLLFHIGQRILKFRWEGGEHSNSTRLLSTLLCLFLGAMGSDQLLYFWKTKEKKAYWRNRDIGLLSQKKCSVYELLNIYNTLNITNSGLGIPHKTPKYNTSLSTHPYVYNC